MDLRGDIVIAAALVNIWPWLEYARLSWLDPERLAESFAHTGPTALGFGILVGILVVVGRHRRRKRDARKMKW